jgi:hypothetical protein
MNIIQTFLNPCASHLSVNMNEAINNLQFELKFVMCQDMERHSSVALVA